MKTIEAGIGTVIKYKTIEAGMVEFITASPTQWEFGGIITGAFDEG